MLGFVSEYLPKTGALGLSIMGGCGMLSVSLILPFIGKFYDHQLAAAIPHTMDPKLILQAVEGTKEYIILAKTKVLAGSETLKYVAILPAFLVGAFLFLHLHTKKNK